MTPWGGSVWCGWEVKCRERRRAAGPASLAYTEGNKAKRKQKLWKERVEDGRAPRHNFWCGKEVGGWRLVERVERNELVGGWVVLYFQEQPQNGSH